MSKPLSAVNWLRLSVFLNLAFILFFSGKRVYYSTPRFSAAACTDAAGLYNAGRNSVFELIPVNQGDVVFAGNSLAEGFPVSELFHSLRVKNRGIGLNQTSHFIQRLPGLLAARPSKIFVEIGINDVIKQVPSDTILARYNAILDLFAASRTVPYIQSLPQVSGPYRNLSDTVLAVNERIRDLCLERKVVFIDLHSIAGDTTLYYDGLHLNGRGYLVWKKAIDSLMSVPADPLHLERQRMAGPKKTIPSTVRAAPVLSSYTADQKSLAVTSPK